MSYSIFISYSHDNADWVDERGRHRLIPWLRKQLAGQAEVWTDHALSDLIGEEYTRVITERVVAANLAILLITQDFVSSNFIMEVELPLIKRRFEERRLCVYPILLTSITPNSRERISWIYSLQMFPSDNKPLMSLRKDEEEWESAKVKMLEGIERRVAGCHKEKELQNTGRLLSATDGVPRAESPAQTASQEKASGSLTSGSAAVTILPPVSVESVAGASKTTALERRLLGPSGSFTDARDGSQYRWIRIGTQIWMAENLAYGLERNGHPYHDEDRYTRRYGLLYDWYAAMKVAPTGWHLPTDEEWNTLESFLVRSGCNHDGTLTGNKIGKSLASSSGWTSSRNIGSVGNNQIENNASGFAALPSGYRDSDESFHALESYGGWWTATERGTYYAIHRDLHFNGCALSRDAYDKDGSLAVRCIKDDS